MFSALIYMLTSTPTAPYPSVAVIIGRPGRFHGVHIVPETGDVETFGYFCVPTTDTTFCRGRMRERSRVEIAAIKLHKVDGEGARKFLEKVKHRAEQLLTKQQTSEQYSIATYEQVLRTAVAEGIEARSDREPSMDASPVYPIFVVQIDRGKGGALYKLNLTSRVDY